jgi:hypothetical protein
MEESSLIVRQGLKSHLKGIRKPPEKSQLGTLAVVSGSK